MSKQKQKIRKITLTYYRGAIENGNVSYDANPMTRDADEARIGEWLETGDVIETGTTIIPRLTSDKLYVDVNLMDYRGGKMDFIKLNMFRHGLSVSAIVDYTVAKYLRDNGIKNGEASVYEIRDVIASVNKYIDDVEHLWVE